MSLQTFKAPSMAEALAQVKREMGISAVILHTRTYSRRFWLGLRRQEVVEITASNGLPPGGRRRSAPQPPARKPSQQVMGYLGTPSSATPYSPASAAASAAAMLPGKALLEMPAANHAAMLGLTQEMGTIKTMVKELVSQVRHQKSPQVPEELFEHYMHMIENQVAEEMAMEIVNTIQRQCRPEHLLQADFVREKIVEQLEKLVPVSGALHRTKTVGPHVVALIGPTGVGKTTTIAKLAAHLRISERRNVGLITIDTYRIAATDQLKKYADIIGSQLRIVNNPEDLRDAIASMSNCDFVLIDTAGRSPNDTMRLNELKNFLNAANPDEVHLVVSTTGSQASVELAIQRFTDVRVDKIIFTKLDEAAHIGVVLNVVRKVNKSLSYITTGQDVPRDIEVGEGRRLAQLIMQGSATPRPATSFVN
jgi:flagellar biosynthesis protein FlhF